MLINKTIYSFYNYLQLFTIIYNYLQLFTIIYNYYLILNITLL